MGFAGLVIATLLAGPRLVVAPPDAKDAPLVVQADLPERWAAAFDSSSCHGLPPASPTPAEARALADCHRAPACVARAMTSPALVATLKISKVAAGLKLDAQLVEAPGGTVRLVASTSDVASKVPAELAQLATKLCAAATNPAPAAADLDLDLPLAPVPVAAKPAPAADVDLALTLPELAPDPTPTPTASVPKPVAPKPVAPKAGARTETIAASAPKEELPAFVLPPPEPTAAPTAKRAFEPVGPLVASMVALVAGGSGAYFGARTLGAARARDAASDAPAFFAAQSEAERDGVVTNASWAVAAGAVVTGAVLFVLAPNAKAP